MKRADNVPLVTDAAETGSSRGMRTDLDRLDRPVPDFVLLGVMKAGSTTLFRRLEQHPDVLAGGAKEPNFFSREENYARGIDWYRSVLPHGSHGLRGEASVEYADPLYTPLVVRRLRVMNPEVRLLLVVRHPVERLRSHYRERVQRSLETRPLADAVLEPDSAYVRLSLYSRTLTAIDDVFDRRQLLVVPTERLDEDDTWQQVLEHIGVRDMPRPTVVYNVSAEKEGFTPAMHKLWELGWLDRAKRAPKPVRKMARRVLMRRGDHYRARLAESLKPVPTSVVVSLAADAEAFTASLGWSECPWAFPT